MPPLGYRKPCKKTWDQTKSLMFGDLCDCGHTPPVHDKDGCGLCFVREMRVRLGQLLK